MSDAGPSPPAEGPAGGERHGLASLIAAMAHTRLELASIELGAHFQALLVAAVWILVTILVGLLAIAFAGVAVVLHFRDTHPVAAAAGVALTFAAIGAIAMRAAQKRWETRPPALDHTLTVLRRDVESLKVRQ